MKFNSGAFSQPDAASRFEESPSSFLSHLYLAGLRMADEKEYREMGEERDWVGESLSIRRPQQTVWSRHCLSGLLILYVLLHKHRPFLSWLLYYALCVHCNMPRCMNAKFHHDVCIFFSVQSVLYLKCISPWEFTDHIPHVASHPKLLWLDVTKHTIGPEPNGHQVID